MIGSRTGAGRGLMAALMIGTALAGAGMPGAARAQEAVAVAIGGQTLAVAVVDFGRSTGWQVAYPVRPEQLLTR